MIIKRFKGGFALTVLYLSLSALYLSLSAPALATSHINPAIDSSDLGSGINSSTGQLQGNCISGDLVEKGNTTVNLGLQHATTASQSIEEIDGSVSADVNLGLFAGGATVTMHTRLEENNNTASTVYRVRYRAGTQTIENRNMTTLGLSVQGQSAAQIGDACGDEFIDSVTLGSDLYLVTQMQFSSTEDYQKYVTKIKVRVLFWSRTDTITTETYDLAQDGVYSVQAISTVPLPAAITAILGGQGEKYCHVDSTNLPLCVTAANDVLDYLVGINSTYRSYLDNPAKLTVIGFNSMPYDQAGHFALASDSISIDSALEGLQNQLMSALTDNRQKQNVVKAYGAVAGPQQADFHTLNNTLTDNINGLETALDNCRNNQLLASCQSATDSALGALVVVDIDI
ncbi:MAG: hypothetical protein ACI8WB_004241 [Phenylobacterium sp.]|jgi:hypothetical protein